MLLMKNSAPPISTSSKPSRAIKIFLAYADEDAALRDTLEDHFVTLKNEGRITVWCKRNILPGSNWVEEVEQNLKTAQLILLLLSANFLASEDFHLFEKQVIALYKARKAHVIPLLLRPVDYRDTALNQLQILPRNQKPIVKWGDRDEAFQAVAAEIRQVIQTLEQQFIPEQELNLENNLENNLDNSLDNKHRVAECPSLEDPFSPVPPDSCFYVNRYRGHSQVEQHCYQTILQPGSLLRIKAPQLMGKTSLMLKILSYAEEQGCRTVYLNLGSDARRATLTDLDQLLRWFCEEVTQELGLESRLNRFWSDDLLVANAKCTDYFEEDIFSRIEGRIILGIDEVDQIFQFPEIASDFLMMLRGWYENGRGARRNRKVWQRISLVMAHSTDVYIPLKAEHSPFNVGEPVELPELTQDQLQDLAAYHGLNWNKTQIEQVQKMMGGHPFLLRQAMYCICVQGMELEQLLQDAPTNTGIYQNHLLNYLTTLQSDPQLAETVRTVMTSEQPVELEPLQSYQLRSMGLVKQQGNQAVPSCDLYRQFFGKWVGK